MEPFDPYFSFILSNSVVQPHKFQQPLGQIWSLISECITKLPKHKYSLSVLYATKKPALWSRISWPVLGHWWYQSKGEKWPFSPTISLKKERLFKKQSKNNLAWKFYTFFSQKVNVYRFKKTHKIRGVCIYHRHLTLQYSRPLENELNSATVSSIFHGSRSFWWERWGFLETSFFPFLRNEN